MRDLTIKVTVDKAQAEQNLRDVDKAIDKVGTTAKASTKGTDGLSTSMLSIGKAAAGFLAVERVISTVVDFTNEMLTSADALKRMSDQTGISVVALQTLGAIAEDSGNSLDQLTTAITQMQNRIASGDPNAVKALETLGLSLESIIVMKPDEQFLAIAREIAKIPDPMERTRLAMDLFGRAGAQILPTLRADIDAIAASTKTMSERSIENWDKLGDTIGRWSRNVKAALGDALMGGTDTRTGPVAIKNAIEDGLRLPDLPGSPGRSMTAALQVPGLPPPNVIKETTKALEKTTKSVKDMTFATRDLSRSYEDLGPTMEQWIKDLNEDAWQGPTEAMLDLGRALDKLEDVRPGITADDMREVGRATQEAALVWIQDYGPSMEQAGFKAQSFKSSMLGVVGDLNRVFQAAFTGGGGIGGAIRSLSTTLGESLFGMIPVVGPFLSQFSGAIIAGLSKLGGKIKGFFTDLFGGPSADELAGRKVVDAFEDNLSDMLSETQRMEAGNEEWKKTVVAIRDKYLEMGLSAEEAMADTERLWRSSVEGAEAAARVIEDIQRKFAGGITVPVNVQTSVAGPSPESFHNGGLVDGWPRAHSGLAIDEVPIVALRGEGVLNRGAMSRIGGADGLNALNKGGSPASAKPVFVAGDVYLSEQKIGRTFLRVAEETRQRERLVR